MKVKKLSAVLFTIGLVLAACSTTEPDSTSNAPQDTPTAVIDEISVVASFYPLAYVTEAIVQDLASVSTIASGSSEPHDFELSPSDVAKIVSSDFAIYIPEFMPSFDAALNDLASEQIIDATNGITLLESDHDEHGYEEEDDDDEHGEEEHGHEEDDDHAHENGDPHVWLNPLNMVIVAKQIAATLTRAYPELAVELNSNLANFETQMIELDNSYKTALAECEIKTLLVSHEAFGYLVDQYGFTQLGISGISPEAEPSPARLAEVAKVAREISATTIYHETIVDPSVANALAEEVSIVSAVLDPIESKPEMGDYLYAMEQNLEALVQGQICKS
ncbi:MAG: metal ABC transporter substrate-binding protein [Candidatus Nanopelagicales bacterium]